MEPTKTPSWYLYVLLRNRWFLLKALLVVMIPTVVITYLLEKKYTVTTMVMPPESQQDYGMAAVGLGLSEFTGFFSGGMGFSLPLMTTMSDVYQEILESRTLVESVILATGYLERVDLMDKYLQDPQLGLYWGRKRFLDNYSVSVTPSGFLKIEVTTGDPWFSVTVSEQVIASLDSINSSINTSRAVRTREYMEIRSASAESLLASAAAALQDFEQEQGIVMPDLEMEAFIQSLASLKQSYMELQAEAGAIRSGISGGSSAMALMKEREAANLLGVIRMLETGVAPPGYEEMLPTISMEDMPSIQFQYARLSADYEMALELASVIGISLQQAMIDERREQQPVRLLDAPMHPGWKSRPKRLFIWLEVFAVALIALCSFLIARENYNHLKLDRPEDWEKWNSLLGDIRGDFSRKGGRKKP